MSEKKAQNAVLLVLSDRQRKLLRLGSMGAQVEREGGMDARPPVGAGAARLLHVQLASVVASMQARERQAHAETLEGRTEVARVRVIRLACTPNRGGGRERRE